MATKLRRPRRGQEMEGTLPLINVVFLLLVFFMVAGALERLDAFQVDAPRADANDTTRPERNVVLIGADGRLAYEDRIVPGPEDLGATVAEARALAGPEALDAPLTVKADAAADAAFVVGVLEALRSAGVRRVSLMTEGS